MSQSRSRSRFHSLRYFIDFDPLLFFMYSVTVTVSLTVTVTGPPKYPSAQKAILEMIKVTKHLSKFTSRPKVAYAPRPGCSGVP